MKIVKPVELERYETVDALCQRWHQVPSAILAEDVEWIFPMLGAINAAED